MPYVWKNVREAFLSFATLTAVRMLRKWCQYIVFLVCEILYDFVQFVQGVDRMTWFYELDGVSSGQIKEISLQLDSRYTII